MNKMNKLNKKNKNKNKPFCGLIEICSTKDRE